MQPDFSVIVPTYRRARELGEALHSVLAQPVSLEVLVVDDSPDGEGAAVVAAIGDARVGYSRMPVPSAGRPAAVRNQAWPQARGRFIHFLDDDDRVPTGHYAAALREFERTPEVGMIFGTVEPFGEDAASVERERAYFARAASRARRCQRLGMRRAFVANQVFLNTALVCSAALVRRECVAGVGGFDTELSLCEDADFYGRVARHYGARFVDRVSLHYRIGHSLMHRPGIDEDVARSYERMRHNYRRQWGVAEFMAMKVLAKTAIRAG